MFLSADCGDESPSKVIQVDGPIQFLGNCRTEVSVSLVAVSLGPAFAPGECSYYFSYFPVVSLYVTCTCRLSPPQALISKTSPSATSL